MIEKNDMTDCEEERIGAIANRLASAKNRGHLGILLSEEVSSYSLADIQVISGHLHAEIAGLPSPYRERVKPYFVKQIFGAHHTLLRMHHETAFRALGGPISYPETFQQFCDMIPKGCFSGDDRTERTPFPYEPRHRLFYYLMAAFSMFVLDRPGHPVGMPFPGGFSVEDRKGTFYCLIRDREKEVFFSICNFCPAKQTEENKILEK